eukprot:3332620-Pleurochrysis_carterae.AAC.5
MELLRRAASRETAGAHPAATQERKRARARSVRMRACERERGPEMPHYVHESAIVCTSRHRAHESPSCARAGAARAFLSD